jgi:5-methylcytosine-specific restriction endonuclease McrA
MAGGYYNVLKVIKRDKYICQMCKKIPALDKLVVHHKDRNRKNNSLTNLITLCRSCHGKIHQKDNNKRIKRNSN